MAERPAEVSSTLGYVRSAVGCGAPVPAEVAAILVRYIETLEADVVEWQGEFKLLLAWHGVGD